MSYLSPETRTVLAQFEDLGFLDVVRIQTLSADWNQSLNSSRIHPEEASEEDLRRFLSVATHSMLESVDAQGLVELVIPVIREVRAFGDGFDYRGVVQESAKAFASEPMDVPALRYVMVKIFGALNEVGGHRKTINRPLSVLRRAENYLKSLRRVVEQLCMDRGVARAAFKNLTDRTRFVERMCVDIDNDLSLMATVRAELTGLEALLSDHRDGVLRCESAIRAFTSHEDLLNRINGRQSGQHSSMPYENASERGQYVE